MSPRTPSKTERDKPTILRSRRAWGCALIAGVLAVSVWLLFFPSSSFDRARWSTATGPFDQFRGVRARMLILTDAGDGTFDCRLRTSSGSAHIVGMSRDEVIDTFGEPDFIDYDSYCYKIESTISNGVLGLGTLRLLMHAGVVATAKVIYYY